jgi:hypothetical protein
MRANMTSARGCFRILNSESWSHTPDGELQVYDAHGHTAGEAGHPARRPLSLTYHKEGGGD